MTKVFVVLAVCGAALRVSNRVDSDAESEMNPIRRIVRLLQNMHHELDEEQRRDKALYEKFFCYCEKGSSNLGKEVTEGLAAMKQLDADIKQKTARKNQLDQEVSEAKKDRQEAKAAIESATAIRDKEKKKYDADTKDVRANLDALNNAVKVLSKGMGSAKAFLQSSVNRAALQKAVGAGQGVMDMERDEVLSFLSQKSPYGDYQASSGEIVGILKEMKSQMNKDLGGVIDTEENAVKAYNQLMAAKKQEVEAATKAIETKGVRSGQLAVEVTEDKNDLENTKKEIGKNNDFIVNLKSSCKEKAAEFQERQEKRSQEIAAVNEAVKVLNSDDALDIFKKTLSSPKSFIQRGDEQREAYAWVQGAADVTLNRQSQLSLLSFMLRQGKVNFSKVITMIDNMVKHLHEEQIDDDKMKTYCDTNLNNAGDEKKSLERDIKDLSASMDELKTRIEVKGKEVEELSAKISENEDMMKKATEQRKEEHAEFLRTQSELTAATQLVNKAKNRLNKFYNPALYKPPPTRELSDSERIAQNMGETIPTEAPQYIAGTKELIHLQLKKNPGPPPKTWSGGLKKSSKEGGVTALMNLITKELDTEIQKGELDEKTAQGDYESLMDKAKKAVEQDTQSKNSAESAHAEGKTDLQKDSQDRRMRNEELENKNQFITELHHNCDFLIDNFDVRQAARSNEVNALDKAKAVLSGANFS